MASKKSQIPISFTPPFLLVLAISLLIIPLKWLLSWLFTALVHELFHYGALCICRSSVLSVTVGFGGARICTEPLSEWKECFCALAGPVGGLLLLVFAPVAPTLAVCAFFQSVYNLLPIYPMDGGRVLFSLIRQIYKATTAETVIKIWTWAILICIAAVCLWFAVSWGLGPIPIVVAGILVFQNKKSLANSRTNEYNGIVMYPIGNG